MSAIPKEQILRLNCPGYGEESYLNIGRAKPLDYYSVIVVNPVSILHLFDKEPDTVRDIDAKLNEGLTSYVVRGDELLNQLESDMKKRIFELVSFLERGGLLIYYLCRPFLIQGPSAAMDNYYWLESLAPDTPSEANVRHMSAVSHGRVIEPTEQGEKSEFAGYLKQQGLEWNTIIRTDFLTEGYITLATSGPRKCIAAHLIAGDNGGRIVFLPSPYSPDFDRSLMESVSVWNDRRNGVVSEGTGAGPAASQPMMQSSDLAAPEPLPERRPQMPPPVVTPAAPPAEKPAGNGEQAVVTQAPPQAVPVSRLNPGTRSMSNLPPVPKFSSNVSRPMPGTGTLPEEPEPRRAKLTAEEILSNVSAQAEKAANSQEVSETSPGFNERATTDLHTAFSELNTPLPQAEPTIAPGHSRGHDDLLSELQAMSAPGEEEALPAAASFVEQQREWDAEEPPPPPELFSSIPKPANVSATRLKAVPSNEPFARPAEPTMSEEQPRPAPQRNLLRELENVGGIYEKQSAEPPASPGPSAEVTRPRMEEKTFFESLSSKAPASAPSMGEAPRSDASRAETSPNLAGASYKFGAQEPAQSDTTGGYRLGTDPPATSFEPAKPAAKEQEKPAASPVNPASPASVSPVSPAVITTPPASVKPVITMPPPVVQPSEPAKPAGENTAAPKFERNQAPPEPPSNDKAQTQDQLGQPLPEAKDLIKKMEEMTKTVTPDWATDFTFPDLEDLRRERDALTENIRQTQATISAIENKITLLDGLKNALLASDGDDLRNACARVFKRLGWGSRQSESQNAELLLTGVGEKAEVISRIVRSNAQAPRADVAQLSQSVVDYWGETEIEPKGILVACTWANRPPSERNEPDFSDGLAEFAQKKNLCLMTTMQLLCMYRDLELGKIGPDEIRRRISDTNGRLNGFQLETLSGAHA